LTCATTSTYAEIGQRIEDVRQLAGQTATFSFWAKASTNTTVTPTFRQFFGSGGSSNVNTSGSTFAVTTSWQRFSVTLSIPSISGKTIGSGNYGLMYVSFTPGSSQTFDTWGWQLEAGSVATPFTTATGTIQGELAACQRYYYRITPTSTYQDIFNGSTNDSTAYARYCAKFPVTMRVAPTFGTTGVAGDYGNLVKTGFAGATGVPTSNDSRIDGITIYLTSASITTGDSPTLRNSTTGVNSNNWLTFSAEL
jgi:hypothetical protein